MNNIKPYSLVIVFTLLLGCSGNNNEAEPQFEQKYIFHMAYYNAAFREYEGVTINKDGDAYHYQLTSWPEPPSTGTYTETELDSLFQTETVYLGTIDAATLAQKKSLILPASQGQLNEAVNICFDAGYYKYSGFLHNPYTGEYTEIIVYEAGDWEAVNEHPSAVELREWLIERALDYQTIYPTCSTVVP